MAGSETPRRIDGRFDERQLRAGSNGRRGPPGVRFAAPPQVGFEPKLTASTSGKFALAAWARLSRPAQSGPWTGERRRFTIRTKLPFNVAASQG
ncbi:hypothetical protein GCM10011324_45100 [Allosediminivita pacifica]|nr:hypothetical protein GCM10011324_45100 [Allosediminivita pacifica]